jgi:hypothetical protein
LTGEHIAASLGKGDRMLRVADRARLEGEAKGWR